MSIGRFVLAALLMVWLTGCSTTPSRDGPGFVGVEPPAEGAARVYILRPAFSKVSSGDSPTLSIDGTQVVRLRSDTYTHVNLRAGAYRISLRPGVLESSIWQADWKVSVEAGRTYFLAIWNQVEQDNGLIFIPAQIVAKPYWVPWFGEASTNRQLRHEAVAQEDALRVMPTMQYLKPESSHFTPQP